MFASIKLYLIAGVFALALTAGWYVEHLRSSLADARREVARLESVEKNLREGLQAVEENAKAAIERQRELQSTHKEIERAQEAPVPAPVERALDGLRLRQNAKKR